MPRLKYYNEQTNSWEYISANGTAGKSAYAYAQEAGYTGTEEEFAAKLVEEIPIKLPSPNALTLNGQTYDGSSALEVDTREFIVTVTDNGDGTYSADHYFADINAAYKAGRTPIVVIGSGRYPLQYIGRLASQGARFQSLSGTAVTTITIKAAIISVGTITLATPDDIPDISAINTDPFILHTANEANEDGGIPIIGYVMGDTTAETTSLEECLEAYLHGKKVLLQINTDEFAGMAIPCTYCDGTEAYFEMSAGTYGIIAYVTEGVTGIEFFEFPVNLPNPNALTINGTAYDGSEAVDMTSDINALIDSKLGVIENGSY